MFLFLNILILYVLVLKVLEWKDQSVGEVNEHWELVKNFRSGRINLNYSSVDVQWNPSKIHYLFIHCFISV